MKNRFSSNLLAAVFSFGIMVAAYHTARAIEAKPYYREIAQTIAEGLPQAHLNHLKFGDKVAVIGLDNYLNTLDYNHSTFLNSDIQEFKKEARKLDDRVKKGRLSFAYKVFDRYKERVKNRMDYVDELLKKGFDFSIDEDYRWKRKESPWPADVEAWNDLWRKKIKHEYLARMVARQMAEEKAARQPPEETTEKSEDEAENTEVLDLSPEEMVRKRYRNFSDVITGHDEEWVLQAYLNAFAQAYDSHSAYLSPRATEDFNIAMKLSLTGIGALLMYDDGAAKVVRLIPGGPADKDGTLKAGDKIVAVAQGDGEAKDILFQPLYKSVRLIRGKPGSVVTLSVIPASDVAGTTVKKIKLTRDVIKLEEKAAQSKVYTIRQNEEGGEERVFGVVNLPDFYADTEALKRGKSNSRSSSRDVKRLVLELKEQQVDGIILDLRNNGGGALQEAIALTGLFINEGPVVQVKQRRVKSLNDPERGVIYDGPLVVLVNRQSASASEIVAAALQDYGRAIVVGDSKTHGKGTVQTMFPLDRNKPKMGTLKVTTAGFYRVSGGSTQRKGVKPDIVVPSTLDVMEIGEEYLPRALPWSWVSESYFDRSDELMSSFDELRQNSEKRRMTDPRFKVYEDLRQRLKSKLEMETITLNRQERVKVARSDQKLGDLQERIQKEFESTHDFSSAMSEGEEKTEDDEEGIKNDLILSETLNILSDYISILGRSSSAPEVAKPERPRRRSNPG